MDFYIVLRSSHLKVFSSISSNLSAGFIFASLSSFYLGNFLALISNVVFASLFVIFSVRIEDKLEEI